MERGKGDSSEEDYGYGRKVERYNLADCEDWRQGPVDKDIRRNWKR